MLAASEPVQRPQDAKLLFVRSGSTIEHWPRSALLELLHPGDLVVANDAATLPASLSGNHLRSGRSIEVRLAGRRSLDPQVVSCFLAVIFGSGDFRMRTEDRPPPPELVPGDLLQLGPLRATVEKLQDHPRLAQIRLAGSARQIWSGLARHGKPIQYSHVRHPLALWDTWSPVAGNPVAFEPPSAGFVLSWETVRSMADRGIEFATLTHSAGLSSTGDPELDARLPFDEPYQIPGYTADSINRAKRRSARVVAVGTTVVRALEHAALSNDRVAPGVRVPPGPGIATQRIGAATRLRVVDSILTGTHEQGTSHYELLRAFVPSKTLARMQQRLDKQGYRTHEFGDSVLVEKAMRK
jgi:S-adenosylmethionine:tRNA ribosyltransferase-isomerase